MTQITSRRPIRLHRAAPVVPQSAEIDDLAFPEGPGAGQFAMCLMRSSDTDHLPEHVKPIRRGKGFRR